LGDKINKIIARLAEANDLKGVIDQADFNDDGKLGPGGKEMVDRLSNLVAIFDKPELDFRKNRAEDDDLLGDAYEYLMKNFRYRIGPRARVNSIPRQEVSQSDGSSHWRWAAPPAPARRSTIRRAGRVPC